INYDSRSFFIVRFVIYMRDTLYYFFIHELANTVGQGIPVYLVRNFRNDDLLAATCLSIHMQFSTNHYPAATKMHGGPYSFHPINNSTCWKVRSFYMLH